MVPADVIFTGGPVFTGQGLPRHGLAVVVRGGHILAISAEDKAESLVGPETLRVNLEGALLSPSFQDAHAHPLGAGLEMLQCDLTESTNAEDALERIREYARSHVDEPWILGGGWSMEHFPGGAPSRTLLDNIVGERPVILSSRDHHSSWVNTAAIRAAGVDANTPDPRDGRIEREPDGFPQGTFHEGAERLFDATRPRVTDEQAYAGLLKAQAKLLSLGITGWQDAWVGKGFCGITDVDAIYRRAVREGKLIVHVRGAQWWQRDAGPEQIEELISRRASAEAEGMEPQYVLGTVKIMVDGVAENYTAAMLTPYHDHSGHPTENCGLSFIDPQRLNEAVTALDAAGFQVHFHALGDRAVREALDAIACARVVNGPSDNRHHLAHLQMVDIADVPRFVEVDATANIQALWACHEEQLDQLALPFLREGAAERHYPFGDLQRAGVELAAGSDWPVSSADPLQGLHIGVNRRSPGSALPVLGSESQTLDVTTMLAAYTSGAARVNHRDHDTGSIAEGYLANLVVIEPDPFSVAVEQLHTTRVRTTWVEGKMVYESAPRIKGKAA